MTGGAERLCSVQAEQRGAGCLGCGNDDDTTGWKKRWESGMPLLAAASRHGSAAVCCHSAPALTDWGSDTRSAVLKSYD